MYIEKWNQAALWPRKRGVQKVWRTFDDAAPGGMVPDLLPVARVREAQVDRGVPPGHRAVLGLAVDAARGGGYSQDLR